MSSKGSRERAATVALWLIVLASVVLLPDAFVRWFLPKDALAAIAVALASFAVARGRLPRWFVCGSVAAALVALASVLMSGAPLAQVWGRWPRYEGIITLPVYFGAVWLGARLLGPAAHRDRVRTLLRAVAAAAIALGLVSALEALGARPIASNFARPGALAGNATDQGVLGALLLAVLALPVLRAYTQRPERGRMSQNAVAPPTTFERGYLTAGLVFAAVAVVVSASRAALLAVGVTVVVLIALELWRGWRVTFVGRGTVGTIGIGTAGTISTGTAGTIGIGRTVGTVATGRTVGTVGTGGATGRTAGTSSATGRALGAVGRRPLGRTAAVGAATLLTLLAGALAVPFTRDRLLGASPLSSSSLEARFDFWSNGLAILAAHPFGVGASGFLNANATKSTGVGTLDSPHNWLLQVAMAGGIPLLLIVLAFVVTGAALGLRGWARELRTADSVRADLLGAAIAGLAGFGTALLTHFTAPSTTILAAVLVGVLCSGLTRAAGVLTASVHAASIPLRHGAGNRPTSKLRTAAAARLTQPVLVLRSPLWPIRAALLTLWAGALIVAAGAEVPLGAGVGFAARGEVAAAEASFSTARSLRPWDADLAGIAAQSFAGAAAGGVPDAAAHAVAWADRSRTELPGTVSTERARAIGQLYSGDGIGARKTLANLVKLAPNDVAVAAQNAVVLYTLEELPAATREVDRALALDPDNEAALDLRVVLAAR